MPARKQACSTGVVRAVGTQGGAGCADTIQYKEYVMHQESWKAYFCGLGAYAVCIVPAILPIFHPSLDLGATAWLAFAAVLASVLVALVRLTEFDAKIGDPGAKFTQALLGI